MNAKPAKANHRLKQGERILVDIPPERKIELIPEKIDLDIVYQDDDLAVINKPQGMVVHPAAGNHSGTLVNALLYHCDSLSGINGKIRPGIVHRIDKDTSGLLVIAKNNFAHLNLSKQIQNKEVVQNISCHNGGQLDRR
jgi:23S rRNA pseudouridine1911/1915/1917 synthase